MYRFLCEGETYNIKDYTLDDRLCTITVEKKGTIDELTALLDTEEVYEFDILDEANAGFIFSTDTYKFVSATSKRSAFEIVYELRAEKTLSDQEVLQSKLDYMAIMLGVEI